MEKNSAKPVTQSKVIIAIVGLLLVFVLYTIGAIILLPNLFFEGRFQDLFAALTSFLSGLAFLGVIYAVLLQKEELGLQRDELKLTRQELKRAAEAQEKSEQALTRQAASLKITAKLNGLSAVLQHYNTLLELTNSARYGINTAEYNTRKREADDVIEKIQRLIADK